MSHELMTDQQHEHAVMNQLYYIMLALTAPSTSGSAAQLEKP